MFFLKKPSLVIIELIKSRLNNNCNTDCFFNIKVQNIDFGFISIIAHNTGCYFIYFA